MLHVFIKEIRNAVDIPVLSIVEETVKFLKKNNLNLVTGQQKNRDREDLIQIINDFEKKDVDCVALACTDLQLLIPKHPRLKIFDTMKIFADATVEEILKIAIKIR